MFATLTKHVNQHCCALEIQKKIRSSRIYMILLGINLPAYTTIIYQITATAMQNVIKQINCSNWYVLAYKMLIVYISNKNDCTSP